MILDTIDTVDRELVHELAAFAESRISDPSSLDGLSELEADVLGTITAKGVIGNGGFVYWFEGKDAADTLRVASSFERVGLREAAAAMRRSLEVFPGGMPAGDLAERDAYLSQHREELRQQFERLDRLIWDADYDVATARYIASRRGELLALEPGFGPLLQRYDAANGARARRLRDAIAALPVDSRGGPERDVDADRLPAALATLMTMGDEQGPRFWAALEESARGLGAEAYAAECGWRCRIAREGALRVDVAFVAEADLPPGFLRDHHRTGHKLAWNGGDELAGLFRSSRGELFIAGHGWAEAGSRREVFLVPGGRADVALGEALVLHRDGQVIGRGQILERRPPRRDPTTR